MQAKNVDPGHLNYRAQYLTPESTPGMERAAVVDRIHEVMAGLDPSFEVPYTHEAIDSLAHVRDQAGIDLVLTWLAYATQYTTEGASYGKIGWGTPPSSARAAVAAAWTQVRILHRAVCLFRSFRCPLLADSALCLRAKVAAACIQVRASRHLFRLFCYHFVHPLLIACAACTRCAHRAALILLC